MNAWFETEWAGVAQVFRIRRHVKAGDHEREETVYGLTNLPRKKANAYSPSNKRIGASKIGCIIVVMSRMARRCVSGTDERCS